MIGEGIKYNKTGLKKRYAVLSKLLHPDKNPGDVPRFTAAFQMLQAPPPPTRVCLGLG